MTFWISSNGTGSTASCSRESAFEIGDRQQIGARRQQLSELDERGPERLEVARQVTGVGGLRIGRPSILQEQRSDGGVTAQLRRQYGHYRGRCNCYTRSGPRI